MLPIVVSLLSFFILVSNCRMPVKSMASTFEPMFFRIDSPLKKPVSLNDLYGLHPILFFIICITKAEVPLDIPVPKLSPCAKFICWSPIKIL